MKTKYKLFFPWNASAGVGQNDMAGSKFEDQINENRMSWKN